MSAIVEAACGLPDASVLWIRSWQDAMAFSISVAASARISSLTLGSSFGADALLLFSSSSADVTGREAKSRAMASL